MNRMVRSSDSACFLPKGCGYDLDRVAQWPPLKSIQFFRERVKQRRACLSYTTADDHDLGIESIDERSDRRREMMDRSKPDLCCLALTAKIRFDQQTCRTESTAR